MKIWFLITKLKIKVSIKIQTRIPPSTKKALHLISRTPKPKDNSTPPKETQNINSKTKPQTNFKNPLKTSQTSYKNTNNNKIHS